MNNHFANKDAIEHVREKRVETMTSIAEMHGAEMPGHLSAATDACRETALFLLLLALFLSFLSVNLNFCVLLGFGLGWAAWKTGRSGWLGWSRLERLHRLIEQEKYEIEHHRPQEREELLALYQEKGLSGKLLNEVVDVLMADQNRLLKVMLEEEMGLTLQAYEHPLQQALGAAIGALIAVLVSSGFFFLFPNFGIWIAAFILFSAASVSSALYEKNRVIPAVIWNLSMGTLAVGISYFLFKMIVSRI